MSTARFLTICMNPTLQKTLRFSGMVMDTVNRTARHRLDASGKGINVSRVLTQLGKSCVHLTQLGGVFRRAFLALCARDGLALEWAESSSQIRFCYTLINDADRSVTELVEEAEAVGPRTEAVLREQYTNLLPEADWIIISGTKAPGFSDELVPSMVKAASAAGKSVVLDLRGPDLVQSLQYRPALIKPNLLEFAETFAPDLAAGSVLAPDCRGRVERICRGLAEEYGCRIILTRGGDALWYADAGAFGEYEVARVEPVNTTGSGDAFTAGVSAALAEGAALQDALTAGCRCGALNAGLLKVGVIQ